MDRRDEGNVTGLGEHSGLQEDVVLTDVWEERTHPTFIRSNHARMAGITVWTGRLLDQFCFLPGGPSRGFPQHPVMCLVYNTYTQIIDHIWLINTHWKNRGERAAPPLMRLGNERLFSNLSGSRRGLSVTCDTNSTDWSARNERNFKNK